VTTGPAAAPRVMLTDDYLEDLREAAEAATAGLHRFGPVRRLGRYRFPVEDATGTVGEYRSLLAARFAVAASPPVVLELLNMVARQRAALAAVQAGPHRLPGWVLELLADDLCEPDPPAPEVVARASRPA
jgi:hypothetical protein